MIKQSKQLLSISNIFGLALACFGFGIIDGTCGFAQQVAEKQETTETFADGADSTLDDINSLGIVPEKPLEGRFVELPDGRFMVPYELTIPGTETTFEMVPIAGGKVKLGSPDDEEGRNEDEGPQVEITIEPFWMGKHEVTWEEYKHYMRLDEVFKAFNSENIRQVSDDKEVDAVTAPSGLYDPSFTYDAGDGPRQPAATMTPFAAKQYTKWLSVISGQTFRLPSEAEWEYACRAGTTTAYYFGDDPSELEEHAWFDDNADWERHDVGELKPNPWGLHDMLGNVAEMVLDQYEEDGHNKIKEIADQEFPVNWPDKADSRVAKGGSWEMLAEECRVASRIGSNEEEWKVDDPNLPLSPWWYTASPSTGVGFRIIRPLDAPPREEMAKCWEADHDSIVRAVKVRIESYGKGSLGQLDEDLPEAIKNKK